jgi:two-component system, sporulation sensor kinase E
MELFRINVEMVNGMNKEKAHFKIPVIYLIISVIWTVFSHKMLNHWIVDQVLLSYLHLFLEISFVTGTAVMLYILIKRQLKSDQKEKEMWKEREEQLRFLINTMPDFVYYKDGEGRWLEANIFALELFQLKDVDYKGKKDSELAQYTDFYREALLGCAETDEQALHANQPTRVEEFIPQPDGTVLIFDAIKVPLFHVDGSRKGLVVIGRNITERKDAERRLEESQERYKSLFEQNPDVVFSLDVDGVFRSANTMCETLTGYQMNELLKMDYRSIVAEHELSVATDYFTNTLQGACPTFEITIRHKSGHHVQIRVTNIPIVVKGRIVGVFGIAADIAEQKMTEELLRKSDRLSVVGQLAAGVAHEIRNPLATLSGFVQLLKEQTQEHHFYYEVMHSELDRINFIVSEFLMLAKPQTLNFQFKDIHRIIKNVLTIAETQAIMNNIQIVTEMKVDMPMVYCDENQLKQVFINVMKNAIEAMPNGGQILIKVNKKGKDHLAVSFTDQGCGIPEDRISKLGEPFYSTKEKGMGLGLMVSYKIIEAHEGRMVIQSQLDVGTTVSVILPIIERKAE